MKNIDLMIFDLDGTLANTGKDLAAAVNHALGRLGLPELQEGLIISYVGDGVETLIKRALGQAAQERHGAALEIFLAYYGNTSWRKPDFIRALRSVSTILRRNGRSSSATNDRT